MTGTNLPPFSVVSWNVNSIRSRLPHLLSLLKERKPTFVLLQELKCTEEDFPFEDIESLGYKCVVHGQKTYNGVAILSQRPLDNPYFGFDGTKSENSARLVSASVGNLHLYSAYIPNGQEVGSEKYKEKLHFYKALFNRLQGAHKTTDLILLGGDFNVAPDDRDVHDPEKWRGHILFSDRERKALVTLTEWGLVDTYRATHPKGRDYSWWDYRAGAFPRNEGLRIDQIYASAPLAKALTGAGVYHEFRRLEKPSDHAPIFASFSL